MKQITYAGESVMTSDEIGTVLVELTAALAKKGLAEAVVIPICDDSGGDPRTAELVIGQGNDVLAVPVDHAADEPDFAAEVTTLRGQLAALSTRNRTIATADPVEPGETDEPQFDYDLDLANVDGLESGATPK